MNDHALNVLEYPQLLKFLSCYTQSETSQQRILSLKPETEYNHILVMLSEVREFRSMITASHPIPSFSGPPDLEKSLDYAKTEGWTLQAEKIAAIGRMMAQAEALKKCIITAPNASLLKEKVRLIVDHPELQKEIGSAVTDSGDILDTASSELIRIRRATRKAQDHIRTKLEEMAGEFFKLGIAQEAFVTIRQDRYVLPVRSSAIKSVPGIVHDKSSSGATVFIEPQSIVEANNNITHLKDDERREIKRILKRLTSLIGRHADSLKTTMELLIDFDLIQSKSRMAEELRAQDIEISKKPVIHLMNCYNPLLMLHRHFSPEPEENRKPVIPLDISIGDGNTVLVITGPNTGGKTVALKSIGLTVMMVQTGIPPVCSPDSTIGVFRDIFADIGDEQSLEQSLSTFSAHLKHIVHIVNHADEYAMVLLDELGAGTDPAEGSALGIAILSELLRRNCMTIATTHHNSIKAFAFTTAGIANAAMEFDMKTLQPTYRILMGQIGQSNAFSIAARLGFPRFLLEEAEKQMESRPEDLEKMLGIVEQERESAKRHRVKADKERERARELRLAREDVLRKAESDAKKVVQKAIEESKALLVEIHRERDILKEELKRLRQNQKKSDRQDFETSPSMSDGERIRTLQDKISEVREKAMLTPGTPFHDQSPVKGSHVWVTALEKEGIVIEASAKDQILVDVSGKRIKVPVTRLRRMVNSDSPEKTSSDSDMVRFYYEDNDETPPLRLNLIGRTADVATDELQKYLDHAFRARIPIVTIVHGFGTGRLQDAVVRALKKHPFVSRIRPGNPAEGGGGVTIVELVSQS